MAKPSSLIKATIKGIPKAAKKIFRPLPYSTPWLKEKAKQYKKKKAKKK